MTTIRITPTWTDTRTVPAATTVARARQVAPAVGITRVADVTGLDRIGIPVVMVCRPTSRSLSVSQGKGLTLDAARASGLMESIELHHAEHLRLPVRISSYRDLAARETVVDPQLVHRPSVSRFTPDGAVPWVQATGMRSGRPFWVPFELVDLDSRVPRGYATGHFFASSNGLASGNTREEAEVHALAEVVERDAHQLWTLRSRAARDATRVDLSSVDDPVCIALLDCIHDAGLACMVSDLTSDVGIACFSAVVADREGTTAQPIGPMLGSGAHPDRRAALARALTEAAQSRLTVIAGSRDDLDRARTYEIAATASAIRAFTADADRTGTVAFHDVPTFVSDLPGNREHLLAAVESAGFGEPLVLDLSDCPVGDDCPASVVKVVAPGLECSSHPVGALGPRCRRIADAAEPT